jgi:hypothetical protein
MNATTPSPTSITAATSLVTLTGHRAVQAKKALKRAKTRFKAAKKSLKLARKASRKAAKLARKARRQLDELQSQISKVKKAAPTKRTKTKAKAKARPVVKPVTPSQPANISPPPEG